MDAFYASVEQRDDPSLRGKPICVGGNKERGVVAAASYEARKYGIKSAMSSRLAYMKCPEVIFVKPRFEAYKEASEQIREIFHRYTDLVEPLSLDEAFLDVTTNKKGMKSATMIAQSIKDEIKQETQLIASAGVSVNKFLAKVASDVMKPDGLFVIPPEDIELFINRLEIRKFFGVGKVTAEKMNRMGVYFGKDLQRYTLDDLILRFRKSGTYYYNICRGIDHRLVNPNRIRKSVGCERTYETNIKTKEDLLQELPKIIEILVKRMEKAKLPGRTLTLKIKYFDFQQITRSKTLDVIIQYAHQIEEISLELAMSLGDEFKEIRLLGLTISNPIPEKEQETFEQLTIEF